MSLRFSADEIFEIAESMERNAATFYRAAAARVQYPGARQMLLDLAQWEVGHERYFAGLRRALTAQDREATVQDPEGETAQYLQALADQAVYDLSQDPLKAFGAEPAFLDVLRYALGREKDAVVFYSGMRAVVPPRLGQDRIDAIILEEKRHVTIISGQIRNLLPT